VADSQRIEDLRRRVQKDPASIAFAQLAEELRRAGGFEESVSVCRAGLELHPGYLSARVTLGRALIELNDLDTALGELEHVLKSAPENLAAIRGLAEIHHRKGSLAEALAQYRAALALARNDPDLQQTVAELARQVEPPPPPASADGLSFEQMQNEFLQNLAPPPPVKAASAPAPAAEPEPEPEHATAPAVAPEPAIELTSYYEPKATEPAAAASEPAAAAASWWSPPAASPEPVEPAVAEPAEIEETVVETAEHEQALQVIGALEQFLDAIHVSRAQPRA
jgi:tetratricopeptide (TPR) repeat protein